MMVNSAILYLLFFLACEIPRLKGFLLLLFLFVFLLFRAAPKAYGGSQARGQIGAIVAGLHHSHADLSMSSTYTTAHGNARSLSH